MPYPFIYPDSAALLKKAYDDNIHTTCPNAQWVSRMSHALNTIAKCVLTGLPENITALFEKAPGLLNAKRFALAYFYFPPSIQF